MSLISRLLRNPLAVIHLFTTAVMAGLCLITTLVATIPANSDEGQHPPLFLWYSSSWPWHSAYWAICLGSIALCGILGTFVMLGYLAHNKYLILASTCILAAGHAWVAQTIFQSFHFATGVTTYPLICLLSIYVFWQAFDGDRQW